MICNSDKKKSSTSHLVSLQFLSMWHHEICQFSNSVTNPKHETRFLFLRGQILTIEVLKLDKGKCIFELNHACAHLTRSALNQIRPPWKVLGT